MVVSQEESCLFSWFESEPDRIIPVSIVPKFHEITARKENQDIRYLVFLKRIHEYLLQ